MMKVDILIAGVGGQGILTVAYVIDNSANESGYNLKQAEVHGMSQRGGMVQSHLRISDQPIYSDLVPKGSADLILGVEPLESLRYIEYLSPDGFLITSSNPFFNIPSYPDTEKLYRSIQSLSRHILLDADKLAKSAGNVRSANMVILGAASLFLPFNIELMKKYIIKLFSPRGEKLVETNLKAFNFGIKSAQKYLSLLKEGEPPEQAFLKSSDFSSDL